MKVWEMEFKETNRFFLKFYLRTEPIRVLYKDGGNLPIANLYRRLATCFLVSHLNASLGVSGLQREPGRVTSRT